MSAVANPAQALHKPTQAKSKYRPEIDGLRAFAVVAVIINHFNKDLLPSGYLGVDIFFVISGYVITSSLADRQSKNFLDFLTGFYERRIKRLVPALVVFVLITSILICLFNPDPTLALRTGGASLFGLSNLYLLKQSTDYFAQSTELNPFTHTWSLGVEEQFYLLFPFLIWFSGFGQQTAKGARNLFLWVGALTIASLIGFIYLYQVNQPAAYFLMPPRFWEMAAGCLIFIGFQKRVKIEQALEQVPPLLVVTAIVGVMFLPVSAAVPATISVVVLSAILVGCLKQGTAAYQFFTLEKVVYVGLLSYSLYLWHWGVLCISRWTIGIHWWSVPFQIAIIALVSNYSYRKVEVPFRSNRWKMQRNMVLTIGIGTLLVGTALVRTIGKMNFLYAGNSAVATLDDTSEFIQGTRERCNGITPPLPQVCRTKASIKSRPTIFLLGDSHAGHLIPLLGTLHKEVGVGTEISTASNYPFVLESNNQGATISGSKERFAKTSRLFDYQLNQLGEGDIVLLSSRWEHHLFEDFYNLEHSDRRRRLFDDSENPINPNDALKIFLSKLSKLIDQAGSKGVRVIAIAPLPVFKGISDPPESWACSGEWFRPFPPKTCNNNYAQKRKSIEARTSAIKEGLVSLARRKNNFYVYDPFDLLCPSKEECRTSTRGVKVFRDDDHLSREGAFYIKDDFINFLKSNNLIPQ
jgi:peptidoglycan/LPS O-acetylase OafA/YrhL